MWDSEKEKYEAIGYLAKPGVIEFIEAMVPEDRLSKFEKEYANSYSGEFPYKMKAGSKYGNQFRIYLCDTDGCPEFLELQLDEKYNNRINDTHFISELVKEYGFKFTREPQNTNEIIRKVKEHGNKEYEWFQKGFDVYSDFLETLGRKMQMDELPNPIIVEPKVSQKGRGRIGKKGNGELKSSFSREQILNLGWLGEAYLNHILHCKNEYILQKLTIDKDANFSIQWFNEGYEKNEDWEDKSIGQGCDLVISTQDRIVYIEVKTSKRKNKLFTMTSNEMQKMKVEKENYFIIKIDYLENLLKEKSPEIMAFGSPYDIFFKPEKMKEATFRVEGDPNE
jgi:hypothetical protein